MDIPGMGFVNSLFQKGIKTTVADKIDETTRAVLAGIGVKEARALLRGEAPTEKPNPRYRAQVKSFMLHIRPKFYQEGSTWFTHTFRLGFLSTLMFVIETITGLILMVYYTPSPDRAYYDMLDILSNVNYGKFMRDMHRLGAELMVILVTLHMVRVYFTGSYKHPRQFTWLTGVVLLLVTLFLSFSGYLLPWDQLAFWAITVGTNIARAGPLVGEKIRFLLLGGNEIAQNALLRFYVLHCFFLPALVLLLFCWHMWRIRKDGGLACVDQLALRQMIEDVPPAKVKTYSLLGITSGRTVHVETALVDEDQHTVSSSPHLAWRLVLVMMATVALASLLTLVVPAPLEEPANPAVTPNPAKAPWYFLWLQELVTDTTVKIGDFTVNGALVGGILIPGVLVLLLAAWPYLDKSRAESAGVWLAEARRRQNLVFLAIVAVILVLTIIGTFLRGPNWDFFWPWQTWPETPRHF